MSDEDARRGLRYLMNGGLPALNDVEFNKLLLAALEEATRRGSDVTRLDHTALAPALKALGRVPGPVHELPLCPSCKHGISGHMRDKHRGWESQYRPHCSQLGCGCGISQEEIEEHHERAKRRAAAEIQSSFSYDQDNAD